MVFLLSAQVSTAALDLNQPFGGAKSIEFTYSDFPSGVSVNQPNPRKLCIHKKMERPCRSAP